MNPLTRRLILALLGGLAALGIVPGAILQRNPATGGMRLDLTLAGDVSYAELRAELWRGGRRAAEVWLNRRVRP